MMIAVLCDAQDETNSACDWHAKVGRVPDGTMRFQTPRTNLLASFVRDVGIAIEAATLPDATFCPAWTFAAASSGSTRQVALSWRHSA